MGKEVPQRHSWDSRDTVQWPVNWPKELKEDPFKARKEVIHQEINRKAKNMGRPRQEKLEETVSLHRLVPPLAGKAHNEPSLQDPLLARGFSSQGDIGPPSSSSVVFKNSDPSSSRLSGPAMSTSGLHSRCSPIHMIPFPPMLEEWSGAQACPTLRRSSRASAQQARSPHLLSKYLERVQPARQCAEG